MDRREFFRRGLSKVAETAVKETNARINQRAAHWAQPPFALPELEFLLACTRCNECIKACPHQVIFPLAARLGADVAGTPAMNLLNRACQLCDDWPCVSACDTDALTMPDIQVHNTQTLPKLARVKIDIQTCLPYQGPECSACAESCPVDDALQWQQAKPSINEQACVGCGLCRTACILEPKAITIQSLTDRAP